MIFGHRNEVLFSMRIEILGLEFLGRYFEIGLENLFVDIGASRVKANEISGNKATDLC